MSLKKLIRSTVDDSVNCMARNMSISEGLEELEERGPVKVGVIGAGTFGTQLIAQTQHMKGLRVSAVCDIDIEKAYTAYKLAGVTKEKIAHAKDTQSLEDAVRHSKQCVISNSDALIQSNVDMIVEATGLPEIGARHAYSSILHRKHVVMVTVEADVVVGPLLRKMADSAGLVYTLAYGDEPSLSKEIFDRAETLGFKVIASGKGTRFTPEFRKATPDDVFQKYGYTEKGFKINPKMFNSFLDGTKHNIEMAALSNMTGLVPDVRGMHFHAVDLRDIPDTLSLKSKGGILEREGVVEAVSSVHSDGSPVERNIRGGVFSVVEAASDFLRDMLESYGEIIGVILGKKTGQALLYRPQHLVGLEAPMTLAHIALYNEAVGSPRGWYADVVTAAKKNLKSGTILDSEGGYTTYGVIERAEVAKEQKLVPFGLSIGAKLTKDIGEDDFITFDDVEIPDSIILMLRRLQEQSIKAGHALS